MGKVRRKPDLKPQRKRLELNKRNQFVAKEAVSIDSIEAENILDRQSKKDSLPNTKKERRKLKHDTFVKKLKMQQRKTKINLFNLGNLRQEIKQIETNLNDETYQTEGQSIKTKDNLFFNTKKPITSKQRNNLRKAEMQRFGAVLGHNLFKKDPLSTVQAHLQNTFHKETEEAMDKS